MQMICEDYELMNGLLVLKQNEIVEIFSDSNQGMLGRFLI